MPHITFCTLHVKCTRHPANCTLSNTQSLPVDNTVSENHYFQGLSTDNKITKTFSKTGKFQFKDKQPTFGLYRHCCQASCLLWLLTLAFSPPSSSSTLGCRATPKQSYAILNEFKTTISLKKAFSPPLLLSYLTAYLQHL